MELTQGEMEIIQHRSHHHPLVLRESLQGAGGYGGGRLRVYCDGCREPICYFSSSSSSSSSSGARGRRGAFYACPNSNCWYLLHKRCAELPPKIEHPSHPQDPLTLRLHLSPGTICNVCNFAIDGFLYQCSDCEFDVHIRCASMALGIQDRVDENKIHHHPLISLEKEAQLLCDACGWEHKGKSYLCPTCGFWANQICASAPTTVDLRSHPHLLTLFHSLEYCNNCEICGGLTKPAYWVYCCSKECNYLVHVGCSLWEEAENFNKDIQTNLHSESTSHKNEISTNPNEEIILITWPLSIESAEVITQLIKNLSLDGRHKRATKILRCKEDHLLSFDQSKDDRLCDGCAQTISSQFYHCAQCNFSLHEWCAELPNELPHILHSEHSLRQLTQQQNIHLLSTHCHSCYMPTNGFVFGCLTCDFYLDLKCASLPRLIKHRVHDHNLVLKRLTSTCNACGVDYFRHFTFFRCEACNFGLCILCALLPFSVRHRYDKHPFALTYSPIKDQLDEYYCEICEEDINSMYWFYHCIKCNQSLHPKCIYPVEQDWKVMFGHLL